MARYELRGDKGPEPLGDLETVQRMLSQGRIAPDAQVRVDGGPWGPVSERSELASHIPGARGLWDAWDEEAWSPPEPAASTPETPAPHTPSSTDPPSEENSDDDPTQEEEADPQTAPPQVALRVDPPAPAAPRSGPPPRLMGEQEEPLEVLEAHQMEPLPPPPPIDVPADSVHPSELEPVPEAPSGGKVIEFPGPKRVAPRPAQSARPRPQRAPTFKTVPVAFDETAPPPAPVLERKADQPQPGLQTRHFWLGTAVVVAAILTGVGVLWVKDTAAWTSDAPLGPAVQQQDLPTLPEPVVEPTPPAQPEPAPVVAPQEGGVGSIVAELREKIPDTAQVVGGDLSRAEDALFVELRRVVAIQRVELEPGASGLELRVTLMEGDALTRSFVGAALVAGKYVDRGELDVAELVVLVPNEAGGLLERRFQGSSVAAFWRGELGAQALLTE